MKKLSLIALSLFICLALFGCANSKPAIMEEKPHEQSSNIEAEKEVVDDLRPTIVRNEKNILLPDFVTWGMTSDAVKEVEKRRLNREVVKNLLEYGGAYLDGNYAFKYTGDKKLDSRGKECIDNNELFNSQFDYNYYFVGNSPSTNQLYEYACYINSAQSNVDYYGHYFDVKETLTKTYGECKTEEYKWRDETYRSDETLWNKAFLEGDFGILASWELDDMMIFLIWDADDVFKIRYVSTVITN